MSYLDLVHQHLNRGGLQPEDIGITSNDLTLLRIKITQVQTLVWMNNIRRSRVDEVQCFLMYVAEVRGVVKSGRLTFQQLGEIGITRKELKEYGVL